MGGFFIVYLAVPSYVYGMTLFDVIPLFLTNLIVVLFFMTGGWAISRVIGDVSFVDALWGLGFVIVAWVTYQATGGTPQSPHRIALVAMTSLWGLRLALHLYLRWREKGPDARYTAFLGERPGALRSFTLVFALQAVLIVLIGAPLYMGQIGVTPPALGWVAQVGIALWAIGLMMETVADQQLNRFRANPDNAGKVLDTGLWRYSRHPNYFGDACVWWGLYLVAAESSIGVYALPAPAIMTFILMKWSGVSLMERTIGTRRPKYADYIARTNAFFPGPPKK